jgi:hypothetical protein
MRKNFYFRRELSIWCFFLILAFTVGLHGCTTVTRGDEKPRSFINISSYASPHNYDYTPTLHIYKDPDKDVSSYRTYAFDYTSKDNPLLEKELFKMLDGILAKNGLKRDNDNPDILLTMSFYVGRKEAYIPPQTITTTRVENIWSTGMIGMTLTGYNTPVPITETQTTAGYTKVSYYKNIRLNFLDYSKIKSGEKLKAPPLVYMAEGDQEGESSDIRDEAPVMLDMLVNGRWVQLGIGTIIVEGHLRGGAIEISKIQSKTQDSAEASGLHIRDFIHKINGSASVDLLTRKTWKTGKTKFRPNCVYSDGVLKTYYGFETDEVELEVGSPQEKTTRIVRLKGR